MSFESRVQPLHDERWLERKVYQGDWGTIEITRRSSDGRTGCAKMSSQDVMFIVVARNRLGTRV